MKNKLKKEDLFLIICQISPGLCLPGLRTLSLNDNELQIIPTEISLMVNLKNLSLRNNQIGTIQIEY